MKQLINQKVFNLVVIFLLLVMSIALYVAFSKINDQSKLQAINSKTAYESLARQTAVNATNAEFIKPVISVTENTVYLPELRIKLPLDDQSLSLLYSIRQVGSNDKKLETTQDIVTRDFLNQAPYLTKRLACYPVRISFEGKPNPFNPDEKSGTPVILADGRTLQIYTTTEESCKKVWDISKTNPSEIAATFQKAESY